MIATVEFEFKALSSVEKCRWGLFVLGRNVFHLNVFTWRGGGEIKVDPVRDSRPLPYPPIHASTRNQGLNREFLKWNLRNRLQRLVCRKKYDTACVQSEKYFIHSHDRDFSHAHRRYECRWENPQFARCLPLVLIDFFVSCLSVFFLLFFVNNKRRKWVNETTSQPRRRRKNNFVNKF